MGRFDGVLICSDVDGTFAMGKTVPPENVEAIRTFQAEGGRFTLATGRPAGYQEAFPIRLNAPLISENGTRISDPETGRTLWTFPLDGSGPLLEWLDRREDLKFSLWFEDGCENGDSGEFLKKFLSHPQTDLLKIVVFGFSDAAEALRLQKDALATFGDRFTVCRSWETGVEFHSPLGGKGRCVSLLRTLCDGVDKIVCVGDYENDLSLLRAADLSFAPANACEEVRSAAGRVVCSCEQGALAAVIDALDSLV